MKYQELREYGLASGAAFVLEPRRSSQLHIFAFGPEFSSPPWINLPGPELRAS